MNGKLLTLSSTLEIGHLQPLPCAVCAPQGQWRLMSMMHAEHARHEDLVIFKTYNEYFPGVAKPYNDDHEHHHESLRK